MNVKTFALLAIVMDAVILFSYITAAIVLFRSDNKSIGVKLMAAMMIGSSIYSVVEIVSIFSSVDVLTTYFTTPFVAVSIASVIRFIPSVAFSLYLIGVLRDKS